MTVVIDKIETRENFSKTPFMIIIILGQINFNHKFKVAKISI